MLIYTMSCVALLFSFFQNTMHELQEIDYV